MISHSDHKYAIWHPSYAAYLKPRQGWHPVFDADLAGAQLYRYPHLAARAAKWVRSSGHAVMVVRVGLVCVPEKATTGEQ